MPWRERSPMDERAAIGQGVPERAVYDDGARGAIRRQSEDRRTSGSSAARRTANGGCAIGRGVPMSSPQATDAALVEAIVAQRQRHPRWGAKKLLAVLRRAQPTARLAGAVDRLRSADGARLGRRPAGVARARSAPGPSVRRPSRPRTTSGRRISKASFGPAIGVYCYPLTLRDGFSRFVLRCDGLLGTGLSAHAPPLRARLRRVWLARTGFAVTTAGRLRARASAGCRGCPSGGSAWALCPSASRRVIPSKTDRTSSFIPCSKPRRRGRPPPTFGRSRAVSAVPPGVQHERPHEALDNEPPTWHSTRQCARCRPTCPARVSRPRGDSTRDGRGLHQVGRPPGVYFRCVGRRGRRAGRN